MKKYKMTLAYDGTNYSGWQVQPNAVSIQSTLQDALKILLKEKIALTGSGRTDAGVHALEQVAHFISPIEIEPIRFLGSMNGLIPEDIRIKCVEPTSDDFHARYSATSKVYHYYLHLDRVQNPFRRLYNLHVHQKLDIDLMQKAAHLFLGEHDFTSFANEALAGSAARNPVRTLHRLDFFPEEGGLRLEFEANGFLYKMVRNIVGMLLEIGSGRRHIDEISKIFAAKDRRQAGKAAAPQGLFLAKVKYDRIV